MKLETIIKGTPVSLPEMLDAREQRAFRQRQLLEQITNESGSLISFSMNIAGEIKSFPLCLAAFDEGLKELRLRIPQDKLLHFEESRKNSGPEAFFLLNMPAEEAKKMTVSIEESHPVGRLFDMDVLTPDGTSVSRASVGYAPRTCLICGENAKACARSRNHTLEVIQWRTAQILNDFFKGRAADAAAACAVRALLYEVSATPKPGLVDRNNSGSHKDMDFFTFLDSSAALIPWFRDFFCIGWDFGYERNGQLFSRLRYAGQEAEHKMFAATKGVNTHKGLIFASAIILGALGKVYAMQNGLISSDHINGAETTSNCSISEKKENCINRAADLTMVLSICRQLGSYALGDFEQNSSTASNAQAKTAGEQFHASYGITGARGEAAAGFPSAKDVGLPALKHWLAEGFSLNDSSVLALVSMLSQVTDTNMIHRGGMEQSERSKKEAAALLSEITPETFTEKLTGLDISYIEKNLSPGGCADLLAVSLLFLFLEGSGMIKISPIPLSET